MGHCWIDLWHKTGRSVYCVDGTGETSAIVFIVTIVTTDRIKNRLLRREGKIRPGFTSARQTITHGG